MTRTGTHSEQSLGPSLLGLLDGGGYHKMSSLPEGTVPAYAYWMNNLNPMEDGKRVLQSAGTTKYIGVSYEWKRVDVGVSAAKSDSPLGGDVPAAVEFGRVAAAPVNTLRQQTHRCQEISVCF